MAPEVLVDPPEAYNMKADVYTFGIVMWEIFSLEMPYGHIRRRDELLHCVGEYIRKISLRCFTHNTRTLNLHCLPKSQSFNMNAHQSTRTGQIPSRKYSTRALILILQRDRLSNYFTTCFDFNCSTCVMGMIPSSRMLSSNGGDHLAACVTYYRVLRRANNSSGENRGFQYSL